MIIFPTKKQILLNFSSCINWEEKYMYIIDLGKLLPIFPESFRTPKYLINECQSYTWITLITYTCYQNNKTDSIKFYGDSESSIIKGIIVIIFSLYQGLDMQSITNFDAQPFLNTLQLHQYLTTNRSQGIHGILNAIHKQIHTLLSIKINIK